MPLPPELFDIDDDTAIVGDIDAFIAYVESSQALLDWQECIDLRLREFEELFGDLSLAA
jgi:hypothetical protein